MTSVISREINCKEFFEYMTQKFEPTCLGERFNVEFHTQMQHPIKQAVIFSGISRGLLHNGNLNHLKDYFSRESGEHIFGKTVRQLSICKTCLSGYNRGLDQMPDGTRHIAELIEQNPNIDEIILKDAQLGDQEAWTLLNALQMNTKLKNLDLSGNKISPHILQRIASKIDQNRQRALPTT